MPKQRKTNSIEKKIQQFVSQADAEETVSSDRNAKRDYKAINLPLNKWEFDMLEKYSKKTNRTKLSFIRNAIMETIENMQE